MNKLWKRLGSDPNIVGKTVQIDGTAYTVVGVLGPGQPDRLDQWLLVSRLHSSPSNSTTTSTGCSPWAASSRASPSSRHRPIWTP
jgi:hypothetical protein